MFLYSGRWAVVFDRAIQRPEDVCRVMVSGVGVSGLVENVIYVVAFFASISSLVIIAWRLFGLARSVKTNITEKKVKFLLKDIFIIISIVRTFISSLFRISEPV